MNIGVDIHESLVKHLIKRFPGKQISDEVINFFFSSGVIDAKGALRMLVKSRYYDLLRNKSSTRSAILDCSIEFNVSKKFVENAIYHYKIKI